jgi:multiple antibiotic resistance protein
MDVFAAVVTLLLIMDPLGNIPPFLSILKTVPLERRRIVLVREILLAYVVLLVFLFLGNYVLRFLRLQQETLSIGGGIVLFLIAIRMIFPREGGVVGEPLEGEPLLVPLAIPLFAGPSTLAALLLLQRTAPGHTTSLFIAVTIAWAIGGAILLSSTFFYRVLRERGLIAIERLMGMLLVMVAVQMLINGLKVLWRP